MKSVVQVIVYKIVFIERSVCCCCCFFSGMLRLQCDKRRRLVTSPKNGLWKTKYSFSQNCYLENRHFQSTRTGWQVLFESIFPCGMYMSCTATSHWSWTISRVSVAAAPPFSRKVWPWPCNGKLSREKKKKKKLFPSFPAAGCEKESQAVNTCQFTQSKSDQSSLLCILSLLSSSSFCAILAMNSCRKRIL